MFDLIHSVYFLTLFAGRSPRELQVETPAVNQANYSFATSSEGMDNYCAPGTFKSKSTSVTIK